MHYRLRTAPVMFIFDATMPSEVYSMLSVLLRPMCSTYHWTCPAPEPKDTHPAERNNTLIIIRVYLATYTRAHTRDINLLLTSTYRFSNFVLLSPSMACRDGSAATRTTSVPCHDLYICSTPSRTAV